MSKTPYVSQWLGRADEDIEVAEILLREGMIFSAVCFHAQQAAEKSLKAFLAFHEQEVRKVHQLDVLIEYCKKIDSSFEELRDDAKVLNRFYVTTRYPADVPDFTKQDAQGALEAAKRMNTVVLKKIG